ncbi:MAG: hypothetical protein EXR92_00210 [Gemmatimonadetes bacterium]|nr:hypothetical protein [Gemmatimonadota bacterium]
MTLSGKFFLVGGGLLLSALVALGLLGQTVSLLVLLGAGGLVLLWALAGALERDLRGHVRRLAAHVRDLARGDVSRHPPPPPYPPELADLEGSLRDLADDVGARVSELERERDELESLIDAIAEGVMALTPDARVLRMNRVAADLLDLSLPALFAPVGALVRHPDLRDYLEDSVLTELAPRELILGERNLLVSTHLLEGGGSVVTFLDVTGLRRMEHVRRDFVANASHELKTPLTTIRGFAETLLEGDPPEQLRREFLASIRNNTLRLQNLVDNLLDLSRLESGGWTAQEEEVDVSGVAIEAWEQVIGDRPHPQVGFDVEGEALALADPQALHQIFRNLFDNSLRYTTDGGRIRVRITDRRPHVQVAVTDTGAGIPSSALPRIFERFYRADPGRDRKEGGTGLGLAIVRHLVQSMKGEVGAESQLGSGTTIRFTLPGADGAIH